MYETIDIRDKDFATLTISNLVEIILNSYLKNGKMPKTIVLTVEQGVYIDALFEINNINDPLPITFRGIHLTYRPKNA